MALYCVTVTGVTVSDFFCIFRQLEKRWKRRRKIREKRQQLLQQQQQSLITEAEVIAGATVGVEVDAAVALNGGVQKAAADGDLEVGSGIASTFYKGHPRLRPIQDFWIDEPVPNLFRKSS